jgi:oxidase EvaA
MAIYHRRRTFFDVIGVTVQTRGREVASWSQPLVAPVAHGLCAFLVRPIRGVPHLLVQGRFEGGLLDMAELAPTVQSTPEGHRNPWDAEQPFLRYVRGVPAHRIRYDTLLSEEGGRFYHAVNRYLLVEVEDGFPLDEPDGYRWVTLGQLTSLAQRSYQVNIQARTLLAAAHSLWVGAA